MSRRGLLVTGLAGLGVLGTAGLGAGLVEAEVLPGKLRLDHALGRCGAAPPVPAENAVLQDQTFRSAARGKNVNLLVMTPPGAGRGLPVVILLHGLGGNARAGLGHRLDRHLAHVAAQGTPPFALVGVDGDDTYWHLRSSGDDPQKMITNEVLPRLHQRGFRTDRIGLMGWSMGGYGALLLAQTLGSSRVTAIVASSPAIFSSYPNAKATNAGAFDDAADFARHDVMAGLGRLRGVATWIDCGHSDPFAHTAERLRSRLHGPAGGLYEGCHDGSYWGRRAQDQLSFLGRHLA
ncbi:MAG: Alpha/beta hydrolase family protein [Streptosporangiaceae bacterium]|jgi:S-formylglutathione hydrolase FrmB|nr:Alpha/beta hydrolase family protein [Streptosporangiaceae bacterium]